MSLNGAQIGKKIVAQAAKIAGSEWGNIEQTARVELQGLAQRLVLIVEACASGEMTRQMAKRHFRTAKFHVVAIMAMLTMLVEAAIEKIVNGALAVIRTVVNDAIGFVLIA
jgi:hypothetical protein